MSLVGQRASDDGFALRVHTVEKSVECEAVRAGCVGFHQALCELSYLVNPGGSAILPDRRSRFGSGLRECRLLTALLVLCHDDGNSYKLCQKRLWGEHPI
jgi:hypothetical protein